MLSSLVTTSRTRNIVEERTLVGRPFRNITRRREMLLRMQRDGLVRKERRLGTTFCEITHEFLVGSILRQVRLRDRELRNLDVATTGINRVANGEARDLSVFAWECVDEHADRLVLPQWAAEAMLRGCVKHERDADQVRRWAGRFERSQEDAAPAVIALAEATQVRRVLSLSEWRRIAPDIVSNGSTSLADWNWLAQSGLAVATDADRAVFADVVRGWVKSWHTRAQ
jgi:hypothetical protein